MIYICRMLSVAVSVLGTYRILVRTARKDPDWNFRLSKRREIAIVFLSVGWAADIVYRMKCYPLWEQCLLGVFAGCLLTACLMDLWDHMVYRFVWWVGGTSAGILLFNDCRHSGGILKGVFPLLFYFVLQELVFGRMYGRADCHAFCVCAAAFAALGMGFRDYVIHMALAFGGLAVTQALRGNIARDGNLKEPVPLIPYITAAFWLWVAFVV